jgi:hypothetical protein
MRGIKKGASKRLFSDSGTSADRSGLATAKAFAELVDLTGRIKNFLFSGIKRVALRAHFNL